MAITSYPGEGRGSIYGHSFTVYVDVYGEVRRMRLESARALRKDEAAQTALDLFQGGRIVHITANPNPTPSKGKAA